MRRQHSSRPVTNILLLITILLASGSMQAQEALPDPYQPGSKINYVRVWEPSVPETNGNVLTVRPLGDVMQTTEYFDGLGRTIQTVVRQGSVTKSQYGADVVNDLVSAKRYDKLGREQLQYLPFASAITNYTNGTLRTDPFQQQAAFMQAQYPDEHYYYSKAEFELSPLSKVVKSLAPGDSWVGNNKGVAIQYELNTAAEGIRIWNIDFAPNSIPYSTQTFAAGKLAKTIMFDEKEKKVYTYTDQEGRTILKKVQDKETGAGLDENSHTGWLCTYYVYDDLGQLRSTITPKAVKYLEGAAWAFTNTDVYQELCFWYEFDERGRAIVKHTPGGGLIHLVYDNKDRLVLSQDENQRSRPVKQWSFYLYDNLDRTIVTGLFDNNAARDAIETFVKALNNGIVYITVYTGANETVRVDNPVAGASGYCNGCSNTVINSVNYYDDYSYTGAKAFNTDFSFAPVNTNPYIVPVSIEPSETSQRIIGFSTGSKTRVINENHDDNNPANDIFLTATSYYDDKGRDIQGLMDNIKNAVDYATMQYDFSGKILSVCEKHTMPGTTVTNFAIISKYEYDWLHRLKALSKKFGISTEYKKLAQYDYDEMGRVKNKKLSPDYNAGAGIETFRYDYNIRGWLNGINKDYALANTSLNQWDHFFGMYMGYDNRDNKFTGIQYNGNLTGAIWKTQGDNMPRRYDYQYDNAGRFTQALFLQKEKPTDAAWNNVKMDFSVTGIQYDENNNLLQMNQKGIIPGNNSPVFIDKLLYEYKQVAGASWSNQLRRVYDQTTDLSATNNGTLGDFKDENYGVNTDDYGYDGNGNLVKDNNKKIRIGAGNGVVFNFMDKPQKITIENKSITEFIYDASGLKLGKKVTNTTTGSWKTTWYMGDFIYEETSSLVKLTMILHEEGRIRVAQLANNPRITQGGYFDIVSSPTEDKGVFDFFVKDNLQNTRMIVTEETHSEFNNATMELASAGYEERMFGQVDANGDPVSGSNELLLSRADKTEAPLWNANTSQKVSKLSLNGRKMGPNMILKVMAGDNVAAKTDYYYTGSVSNPGGGLLNNVVTSLLSALSNNAPTGGLHGAATNITNNITANPGEFGTFLNNQNTGVNTTPQAYMNVLFFDENFNFVPSDWVTGLGSNAWRVGAGGDGQSIPLQISKAPKNGYAFVYLSNESQTNVFFDNFEVTHIRGRLIEENAYYPYGLKINGLSAKAFDKGDNKYGYQGDFSEKEEETGWDEFDLRMYDAQIGRWTGVDPYDEFASPYLGMGGNPVNFVDEDGGSAGFWGALAGAATFFTAGYLIANNNIHDDNKKRRHFQSALIGFGSAFIGAGIGYGVAEHFWGNEAPIFANVRGFYGGLFGDDAVKYRIASRSICYKNFAEIDAANFSLWGEEKIGTKYLWKDIVDFDSEKEPGIVSVLATVLQGIQQLQRVLAIDDIPVNVDNAIKNDSKTKYRFKGVIKEYGTNVRVGFHEPDGTQNDSYDSDIPGLRRTPQWGPGITIRITTKITPADVANPSVSDVNYKMRKRVETPKLKYRFRAKLRHTYTYRRFLGIFKIRTSSYSPDY
jgi:RHS repeat-associated protein